MLIDDIIAPKTQADAYQKSKFRGWSYIKKLARLVTKFAVTFWWKLLIVLAILVVTGVLIALIRQDTSGFPNEVKDKASFSISYPRTDVDGIEPKLASVNYSDENHGLSYEVYVNSVKVIVSQQSTPDIFSENGVYNYKLTQAHEYSSFTTNAGEVTLTRPGGDRSNTVAWVNAKGTLTFARAFQDLSETQWKTLFNSMKTVN